jgi:hopanoid biosynthesis associated RND transporter like protein HpnN
VTIDKFNRCCDALVALLKRGAWWVILVSLALAVLSVNYAYHHLTFRTNRSDLVASDQRLLLLGEKLSKDFGSRDDLVVVVENGKPARTKAFADALAKELKKYPKEFPEIFYRLQPAAFKKWALLYLEPKQLQEIKDKLQDHQALLAGLAADPNLTGFYQGVNHELTGSLLGELFTGFLQEDQQKPKVPDLSLLIANLKGLLQGLEGNTTYKSPLSGFFLKDMEDLDQEGYFLTENDQYLLFLVTPQKDGFVQNSHSVKLLRDIVAKVEHQFPGLKAGVTGPMALEADEMGSATKDIALATWLSLAGQLLLLIMFFRSIRRTLIEGLVLIVGLCWTFGVATLVVGHLNLLSIVFAPLMLGITIDFGVHWFCRLEEEQSLQGKTNGNTMNCTMNQAAPAIIYAALAAAASFVPLTLTGFKGLAELGVILTIGVLLMLVATLTLLPSLVLVSDRFTTVVKNQGCQEKTPKPFLHLRWRRPALLVSGGLALAALGAVSLLGVNFDLNPLHLQNQKTESVVWEMKLMKNSRYSTAFGAITTNNLKDLEAKSAVLKKLPTVSHVESILSFMPSQAEAKREQLNTLAPMFQKISFPATLAHPSNPQDLAGMLGGIHFKLARALESDPSLAQVKEAEGLLNQVIPLLKSPAPQTVANLGGYEQKFFQDLRDKWDFLRDGVHSPVPHISDLPAEVRDRFISPQGTYLLRVFSSQDIWDPAPLGTFVHDLQRVDPDVTGDPVLLYYFTQAFRNACLWAAGIGLLVIAFMLFGVFRSLKLTLLALIPLFVGTGWTLNLMWLLNIPFNQANVLFLPLILGEGIEFGIIILVRWQMEESARVITLPASTAKGVLLAALTTTVGFGSLMVSGHQGTFSLGLLATVGSLSVLLASLSVLPAFLRLMGKQATAPQPQLRITPVFKRLLLLLVGKEVTVKPNLEK